MSDLDDIVSVTVTATSASISRRGFGTPLVVGYHTEYLDRVRAYASIDEAEDDGHDDEGSPIHRALSAIFAQNPRPPVVKVGRRAGAPTQSMRLTPSSPVATEEYSVTIGDVTFAVTADSSPSVAEICAAFTRLINADADAISASGIGSTATIQTVTTFNGVLGGTLAPARNVTITFSAHSDWDATNAILTGTDPAGRVITETFAIPNGGGTTVTGTKVFATVTSLLIPAQTSTGGTLTIGVGVKFENALLDVTATDNTTNFDVAVDVAGKWFAYEDLTANLSIDDRTSDPGTGLATDLGNILAADDDWYGLIVADGQSHAQITAAAAWMETHERFYMALSMDSDVPSTADDDIASTLLDLGYDKTHVHYTREGHGSFPDAAWFGRMLPKVPGSATYENKTLRGVPTDDLSTTAINNLKLKNASFYHARRGRSITRNSKAASGRFIDLVVFIDWLRFGLQEDIFAWITGAEDKIPYTDASVAIAVNIIMQRLRRGIANNAVATDPAPSATGPLVADVAEEDRANRHLPDLRFECRYTGAIHSATVVGNVSV